MCEINVSNKITSMDRFVAGIAHEINNPVNFIYSALVPLQRTIGDMIILINRCTNCPQLAESPSRKKLLQQSAERMQALMDSINGGIERIIEIINNMLALEQSGELHAVHFDINKNIEAALQVALVNCTNNIEIRKSYGSNCIVEGCPGQINQVMINILVNSLQSVDENGKIRIKTTKTQDYVLITVSDTGTGISEETLPHIFDPFFTTKCNKNTSGLGLTICYEIVQRHGGKIWAQSIEGEYTTFYVKLPVRRKAKEGLHRGK